jgi:hypothetical protein
MKVGTLVRDAQGRGGVNLLQNSPFRAVKVLEACGVGTSECYSGSVGPVLHQRTSY